LSLLSISTGQSITNFLIRKKKLLILKKKITYLFLQTIQKQPFTTENQAQNAPKSSQTHHRCFLSQQGTPNYKEEMTVRVV